MKTPIVEFYYKNDDLDDPFINDEHVKFLDIANDEQIAYIKEETRRINELLKDWFAQIGLRLMTSKLELVLIRMARLSWQMNFHQITACLWDAEGTIWTRMFSVGIWAV